MKKVLVILIMMVMVLPMFVLAKDSEPVKANVYMFRGEGCGFCKSALEYFDSIKDKYDFNLITYEVWYNEQNSATMLEVADALNKEVKGVPFIVIGKTTFAGYASDYNADIVKAIKAEIKNNNKNDIVKNFANKLQASDPNSELTGTNSGNETGTGSDFEYANESFSSKSKGSVLIFAALVVGGIVALVILGRQSVKGNEE